MKNLTAKLIIFSLVLTSFGCNQTNEKIIVKKTIKSLNNGSNKFGSNCCLSTSLSVSILTTAGPTFLTASETKLCPSKEFKAETS